MINKDRLKKTFIELVEINGESGNELKVAEYLKEKLKGLEINYRQDNAGEKFNGNCGNIIAFLESSDLELPAIMLCAHMDTIEPTKGIKTIVEDGCIRTDMTTILGADNRAGVACIIELLTTLKEKSLKHPPLYILFSVAEEIGMYGAKNIRREEIEAHCGFVFDCSAKSGQFVTNAPTSKHIVIKIYGKASHAAVQPENGINAIKIAANAISKLRSGRISKLGTFNFGKIKGGKAINIIPEFVEIEAESRSTDNKFLNENIENLKAVFETEAAELGGGAEIQVNEKYHSFNLDNSDDVVKIASGGIKKIGFHPLPITYPGGSDANIYNSIGIPTVNLGIGFRNVHSNSEYIKVNDLNNAAEIGLSIIEYAHGYLALNRKL